MFGYEKQDFFAKFLIEVIIYLEKLIILASLPKMRLSQRIAWAVSTCEDPQRE